MSTPKVITQLQYVLLPLKGHDSELIRKKIEMLKQTDAEGWAIGEVIERAFEYFDIHSSKPKANQDE